MTDKRPVLDADSDTGMVIGWADTADEAARILRDHTGENVAASDIQVRRDPVTYDLDINTRAEAEAVEKNGAWVLP